MWNFICWRALFMNLVYFSQPLLHQSMQYLLCEFLHIIMMWDGNVGLYPYPFISKCLQKICKMTPAFDSGIALFKFIYFISHPYKMWYIAVILLTNINLNVVGEYKRIMAIRVAYLIGGFSTRSFKNDMRHSEPLLTIDCSNVHSFCSHNE